MEQAQSALKTVEATCQDHGTYLAFVMPWSQHPSVCPKCLRDTIEREHRHDQHAMAAQRRAQALANAGIPPRYLSASFESFDARMPEMVDAKRAVETYARTFREPGGALATGRCLALMGGVGTGKTHLACAAVRAVLAASSLSRAYYLTVMDMIAQLRATWSADAIETEERVINRLARADLLVLDEVGVQYGTPAEQLQVTRVIDKRSQQVRPTIVITNLDVEGAKAFLGARAWDRLREGGGAVVLFNWDSERGRR